MLGNGRVSLFVLMVIFSIQLGIAQTPFNYGTMGQILLDVKLSSEGGSTKTYRMILDTGSSVSVISKSISSMYWSQNGEKALAQGSVNQFEAEPVLIKELQFGGKQFREITAIRVDLDGISRFDDDQIDGIIGMDILKNMVFGIDFINKLIVWNDFPKGLLVEPLSMSKLGCPEINIYINRKNINVKCDTGSNSFLVLSKHDSINYDNVNNGAIGTQLGAGALTPSKIENLSIKEVSIAATKWCLPDVVLGNGPSSLLGLNALWPLVWFDFPQKKMALSPDATGCLRSIPPVSMPIHVYWNRHKSPPELTVMATKPNSIFESSGLLPGDVILEINDINRSAINIKKLIKILLNSEPIKFIIKRGDKIMTINIR